MRAARFIFDTKWKVYGDGRLFRMDRDPREQHPLGLNSVSGADRTRVKHLI